MGSSIRSESNESGLDAELCQGGIDIAELKPWNHLELSENRVEPAPIPCTKACCKFEKIIKSIANFEAAFGAE